MTEDQAAELDREPRLERPEPTGFDEIDEVLAAVVALDARPLEEHVEVFEEAHSALRRALDHAPDPQH